MTMPLGIDLGGYSRRRRRGAVTAFSPSQLFASNEQGLWLDPSDTTTMFQNASGTTPVTGVEQAVGLMLDKSKGLTFSNGVQRYNLLERTEEFDNVYWNKALLTVTQNATIAPNNTTTADLLIPTAVNGAHYLDVGTGLPTWQSGTDYTISVSAKAGGYQWLRLAFNSTLTPTNNRSAWFDVSNGVIGTVQSGVTATIVPEANGFYRCTIRRALTATAASQIGFFVIEAADNSTANFTGNGTDGIYLWGADVRLASQANAVPTYQPITSSWAATMPGNHVSQSADARRPILRARYNLLERTEEFDNAYWTKTALVTTGTPPWINVAVAPDGTTTADKIIPNTSVTAHFVGRGLITGAINVACQASAYLKADGYNFAGISDFTTGQAVFNLQTGQVVSQDAGITAATPINVGNGWWLCSITYTATTSRGFGVEVWSDGSRTTFAGNGTSGILVWGADLRVANDGVGLPVYQRVGAATDYDTVGFPPYLAFDGTDDCLFTASTVNFTATDEMTVVTGIRKIGTGRAAFSDPMSSASFNVYAPSINTRDYTFASGGTLGGTAATASVYSEPITNVLSGTAKISTDTVAIRINGSAAGSSSADQGTGNYSAFTIFLGARANTDRRFTGRMYGFIVRGATTATPTLEQTETWMNGRTKAY